jgi:hypothetical protein
MKGSQEGLVLATSSLLGNVQVYSLADKYNIPRLKGLAKAKFMAQAHQLLSVDHYPDIIREIYESTPSSDRGLRDAVTLACVENIRTLIPEPVFSAVLKDVGDFGFDLLCESLKSDGERLDQMFVSTTVLEDEIEEIKIECMRHKIEKDQHKEQFQQVIKAVNAHRLCRHCDAEFNERLDENEPKILRCGQCRTKHQ